MKNIIVTSVLTLSFQLFTNALPIGTMKEISTSSIPNKIFKHLENRQVTSQGPNDGSSMIDRIENNDNTTTMTTYSFSPYTKENYTDLFPTTFFPEPKGACKTGNFSGVAPFNITLYLGKWYEIARSASFFAGRNCTCVTAEYSLAKSENVAENHLSEQSLSDTKNKRSETDDAGHIHHHHSSAETTAPVESTAEIAELKDMIEDEESSDNEENGEDTEEEDMITDEETQNDYGEEESSEVNVDSFDENMTEETKLTLPNITVANTCRKFSPKAQPFTQIGKARLVSEEKAELRVSFFEGMESNYNVVALDENYQWAVVLSCSKEPVVGITQAWVLSRTPSMDEELFQSIVQKMKDLDIDLSDQERTIQEGC